MGLQLRYNLFHGTTAAAVYGAYSDYYKERGFPFQDTGANSQRIDIHQDSNNWVVVDLDDGWEWKNRREAQLFISQRLCCPGFLVFVYDGNYWGYEFFDRGEALDHFVQESTGQPIGFPNCDNRGRPEVVTSYLPHLQVKDFKPYLIQKHDGEIPDGLDVPARPGDEFARFKECGVVDFLRMLGVNVRLVDAYVRLQSPVYRTVFKVRKG